MSAQKNHFAIVGCGNTKIRMKTTTTKITYAKWEPGLLLFGTAVEPHDHNRLFCAHEISLRPCIPGESFRSFIFAFGVWFCSVRYMFYSWRTAVNRAVCFSMFARAFFSLFKKTFIPDQSSGYTNPHWTHWTDDANATDRGYPCIRRFLFFIFFGVQCFYERAQY